MNQLVVDCVVIDVSQKMAEDYVVSVEDVEVFENTEGAIKPNTFVIVCTGWDQYWSDPERYINNHQFPSIHEDVAKLLLNRGVVGLGIDTLSSDTGKDGFPVHRAILSSGKYLVENIANAKALPPTGSRIAVLPIKIKDGTEAPIRLVAFI